MPDALSQCGRRRVAVGTAAHRFAQSQQPVHLGSQRGIFAQQRFDLELACQIQLAIDESVQLQ